MRAFVTGITGFAGGHLAEHLVACGDEVVGCSRRGVWPVSLRHLAQRVGLCSCDLGDATAIETLLGRESPDFILHLAALADPKTCRDNPDLANRQNTEATRNLYEAIRRNRLRTRVLYVSTSYVYGPPRPEDLPLKTDFTIRTDHPYSVTKWQGEQLSVRYVQDFGLDIIRVRPFNHTGPRQSTGYIVPDWAEQVAAIEAGRRPPVVSVGNLASRRDYTDVRDIVRAYRLLIERAPNNSVYNLGSGTSHSGQEIMDLFGELSRTAFEVRQDPGRLRGNEPTDIVADIGPLRMLTDWRPAITLRTTIGDTLEFWRGVQGGNS